MASRALNKVTAADVAAKRTEFWSAGNDFELPRDVTAAGLSRSMAWMEKAAIEGGGPPYRKCARGVLYRKGDVLEWLNANSQRVTSTAQLQRPQREAVGAL
jgi:hypothetical protein